MATSSNSLYRTSLTALIIAMMALVVVSTRAWAEDAISVTQGDVSEEAIVLEAAASDDGFVASGTSGSCFWGIDAAGTLVIRPANGAAEGTLAKWRSGNEVPWGSRRADIKIVRVEGIVHAQTCYSMFEDCTKLTSLNLSALDTSQVADMGNMFSGCTALASFDASVLDVGSVTSMDFMFCSCEKLASLDVADWDTSSVERMNGLFASCYALTALDVSDWDTSRVTSMGSMFSCCYSLASLDLSSWDTGSVTYMGNMFWACEKLVSLNVSGWDTSRVTSMESMFVRCNRLVALNTSSWDTSQVTTMASMFSDCSALTSLETSGWDTSQVTDMRYMFSYCLKLASLDVSNWNTSLLASTFCMFDSCSNLTSLDVSNWDTSNVTDMCNMFSSCSKLASLDVSGWDTSQVTDMSNLFSGCSSLAMLDVSDWDTASVKRMSGVFSGCTGLTSLDPSGWDTSSVTDMGGLFYSCPKLASLNLAGWDTSQVTDMSSTFSYCTSLSSLDVTGWDTSRVTDTSALFNTCICLSRITIGEGFNISVFPDPHDRDFLSWKSAKTGKRYTAKQISSSRRGVADTYSAPFFIDAEPTDSNNHGAEVDWMGVAGISTGWKAFEGLEFRGLKKVTRCDFAAFLYRLADLADDGERNDSNALPAAKVTSTLKGVSDCDAKTSHAAEIAWMIDSGISQGWQDKGKKTVSFKPMANVARQDMAAFLYRFADIEDDGRQNKSPAKGSTKITFSDVRHGDTVNHAPEVEWLASVGVTTGWKVGSKYEFRGAANVARQDMAAFMKRLYDYLG